VREVATGVWRWRATHAEWRPRQKWDWMVSFGVHAFEGLEPLDVPVELVLPTHDDPAGGARARALAFVT
jgi:hypothetical protein